MNLMLNGLEAMRDTNSEGQLTISSVMAERGQLLTPLEVIRPLHNPSD
jgi:hypothetical protein